MTFEVGELRESSQTELTFVRFLFGVYANVTREGGVIAESFVTAGALERALAGMPSNVRVQVTLLTEGAVAVRADERLDTFVQFDMFIELPLHGEAFNAVVALERFLIFMRIVMNVEFVNRVYDLLALGTLVQAVGAVRDGEVLEQRLFTFEQGFTEHAFIRMLRIVSVVEVIVESILIGETLLTYETLKTVFSVMHLQVFGQSFFCLEDESTEGALDRVLVTFNVLVQLDFGTKFFATESTSEGLNVHMLLHVRFQIPLLAEAFLTGGASVRFLARMHSNMVV